MRKLSVFILLLLSAKLQAQSYTSLQENDVTIDESTDYYLKVTNKDGSNLNKGWYTVTTSKNATLYFYIAENGMMNDTFKVKSTNSDDQGFIVMKDNEASYMEWYKNNVLVERREMKNMRLWRQRSYGKDGDITKDKQFDDNGESVYIKRYHADSSSEEIFYLPDYTQITSTYFPSGKMESTDTTAIGKHIDFYENGRIKMLKTKNGNTIIQKDYDENDVLLREQRNNTSGTFRPADVLQRVKEYYPNGKVKKEVVSTSSHETTSTYNNAGKLLKKTTIAISRVESDQIDPIAVPAN